MPPLAVIGDGRAGGSIAVAARAAGLDVRVAGRDGAVDSSRDAEVALLCVPDTSIQEAAAAIAPAIPPLRFVGHVSGSTGLDALAPASEAGADVFSLHPLQTLPDAEADLAGAACAVSGSTPAALELAERLGSEVGMTPFRVEEADRAAYHAAASMASNFLVALEESAAGLMREIGIDDARSLLAPLVLRSAANWAERGGGALTGPVARGDIATVARQRAAIAETAPELIELYDLLTQRAATIAGVSA